MVYVTFKCKNGHSISKGFQAGKIPSVIDCDKCDEKAFRNFNNVEVKNGTTEETRDATDLMLYGETPSGRSKVVY